MPRIDCRYTGNDKGERGGRQRSCVVQEMCIRDSAWVQVYIPGPGWVDFDPSAGTVGNENLIRVAVAHDPREAIPLQGTWFGTAADHLAMKVAVKVTTAAAAGAADCMDVGMMNKRAEDGTEEAFLRRATVRSMG